MKKELKDYLHLYLGCKVMVSEDAAQFPGKVCILDVVDNTEDYIGLIEVKDRDYADLPIRFIKPILRPLSDMTEEERICFNNIYNTTSGHYLIKEAASHKYLISKHFDLFDLIHSGLAIDATTLKETNPAT